MYVANSSFNLSFTQSFIPFKGKWTFKRKKFALNERWIRLTLRVKYRSWRVVHERSFTLQAWQILMLDQFCLKLFCYLVQLFDKRKSIYLSLMPTSGSTSLEPGVLHLIHPCSARSFSLICPSEESSQFKKDDLPFGMGEWASATDI